MIYSIHIEVWIYAGPIFHKCLRGECVRAMSVNVCTVFLKKKLRCKINPLNLFQFLSHVINRTSSNEDFVR